MTMKKKANGEGSIRKRPDGVWEGRFYVDGKRKSVYGSTKTEARKLLTQAMNDVDNDSYMDETNMTVSVTMGHATVAFALDRYGHVSNAMRTDAANRMTAFINNLNVTT